MIELILTTLQKYCIHKELNPHPFGFIYCKCNMTAVSLPKKRSKRKTQYNYNYSHVTGSDIEELLGIYVVPQKPKAIIMSLELVVWSTRAGSRSRSI